MLNPAPADLFYRRNDPHDSRLGERANAHAHLSKKHFALLACPDDRGIIANGGRAGAAKGPDAIRQQLYRFPSFQADAFSLSDLGNLHFSNSLEKDHASYASHVTSALDSHATCISLGGGNDYAFAEVLGLSNHIKDYMKIGAINIDAHLDVRDLRFGITSGTPYYRALEQQPPILHPQHFVEFACQPKANSLHHIDYLTQKKVPMAWLDSIREKSVTLAFKTYLETLSKTCSAIAVSLDIDAVAQAYAPGVSAPSPNGLSSKDVESIARLCGEQAHVRLFSIYEVNPEFDRDHQTSRLAASAIWNFMHARILIP